MRLPTHSEIWSAIDAMAAKRGVSASRLAIMAGLDSTALNKSKRVGRDGKERWPSVETIVRLAAASGCDWKTFANLAAPATGTNAP